MTKRVDFNEPASIEQIEAIGSLYKAFITVATAYGLDQPHDLLKDSRYMVQYQLNELLEKQTRPDKKTTSDKTDAIPF